MQIDFFYEDGDLVKGMKAATDFIRKIGELCVTHVYTEYDAEGGWLVNVVYDEEFSKLKP